MTISERIAAAQAGTNPTVIERLRSGWLVAGDTQVVRGYCLLLADPVVENLNSLAGERRAQFLSDMASIGDCLLKVTDVARVNYEILGNLDKALHAHLFPRYEDEDESVRAKPIWLHDWDSARAFDPVADAVWISEMKLLLQGPVD